MGVFCGRYKTPVPDGYLEHLDQVRGSKAKAGRAAATDGSSGPVATAGDGSPTVVDGDGGATGAAVGRAEARNPEHREDVG